MKIQFRITSVDEYGYNGRDLHPSKSDIGLVVRPVKMDVWLCNNDDIYDTVDFDANNQNQDHAGLAAAVNNEPVTLETEDNWTEIMWTVVTPDGRFLQMMEHELELVKEVL